MKTIVIVCTLAIIAIAAFIIWQIGIAKDGPPAKFRKADPLAIMSDDDLDMAVCNRICGQFPQYDGASIWVSGNYDPSYWNPLFSEEQSHLDDIHRWALSYPMDARVRDKYLDWVKYYERELSEARGELRDKSQKHEMEDYNNQQKALDDKINKVDGAIPPIPKVYK